MIVEAFGKERVVEDLRPHDFERFKVGMPSTWGAIRRGKMIQMTRTVFRYASEQDLIDKTVKFGELRRPDKKVLRLERAKNGKRMFEATEVRAMLQASSPQLKAMILLAANCAFGNNDVASLPIKALDLEGGWVSFPRPKTGIERRCKLWPETVDAIREALEKRPKPKDEGNASLVFLTRCGTPWVKVGTEPQADGTLKVRCDDAVSKETKKLLKKLGIEGRRNFYTLRHTFRTIADEAKDQPAVDFIMGHALNDMASIYRERIGEGRLVAVAEFVRHWLFSSEQ
jgi:integrase